MRVDFNSSLRRARRRACGEKGVNALTEAIASSDQSRNGLLMAAVGGVLTGILTPLLPPLIDKINGSPGDFRIALVAIPFAILVLFLVRRLGPNPR